MTHVRLVARPYDWALDEPSRSPLLDADQRRAAVNREMSDHLFRSYKDSGIPVVWHTEWTRTRKPADPGPRYQGYAGLWVHSTEPNTEPPDLIYQPPADPGPRWTPKIDEELL